MFLEDKNLKTIGVYMVFYISMHPTNTNVDTYNEYHVDTSKKKTYTKPMVFDDF